MRNPNRTTKGERRFVRRYNPYAARILGVAQAARWYREGVLLDEASGFDNLVNDLMSGLVPLDLNGRITAAIDGQRDALERIMGVGPGMLGSMRVVEVTATRSKVNHYSAREPMFTVMTDLETDAIIEVHQLEPGEWQATVDAMTRAPGLLTLPENLGGGTFEVAHAEAEPLGPSACGHYEVVEETMSVDALAVPYLSEPRPQVVPESWVTIAGAEGGQWFAKYQAYREGREAGEEYLKWNGDPWHDPNEVAAVHAEAIEDALNDDIDPGDEQP